MHLADDVYLYVDDFLQHNLIDLDLDHVDFHHVQYFHHLVNHDNIDDRPSGTNHAYVDGYVDGEQ